MFLRAALAFVACPGLVAYLIPILLVRQMSDTASVVPVGLVPLIAGTLLLLWCVRDFHVSGKGTLAPWAPPANLVVVGLYRFSRNPMYIAVSLVLLGWASCFWSSQLLIYAAVVFIAFHLRIVFGEEPYLARRYGDDWRRYSAQVPRWLF